MYPLTHDAGYTVTGSAKLLHHSPKDNREIHTMILIQLVTEWREEGDRLRSRYQNDAAATIFDLVAEELERELMLYGMETLTLATAEIESGYTRGHLRRLIRDKTIPNAGTADAPLIQRRHLPVKPGYGTDRVRAATFIVVADREAPVARTASDSTLSRTQVARAIAAGDLHDGE